MTQTTPDPALDEDAEPDQEEATSADALLEAAEEPAASGSAPERTPTPEAVEAADQAAEPTPAPGPAAPDGPPAARRSPLARLGTPGQAATGLLLGLSFLAALAGALFSVWWVLGIGLAAGYLCEYGLRAAESPVVRLMRRARFGMSVRMACRQLLLVGLLALALRGSDGDVLRIAIGSLFAVQVLQAAYVIAMRMVVKRRQLPVVTRNIDVKRLRIGDAPPAMLLERGGEFVLFLDVFAVAGTVAAVASGATVWAAAGCGLTVLALLGCCLALVPHVLGKRGPVRREAALEWLNDWLAQYRPTTVLYFSGSADSAYQAAMWLEPLAALGPDERPLVVLRERGMVPKLELTSLPVLCVPSAVHLMNADLSTVRVALYPANVGKNIHLLRAPHIKHVFIGHGDSDKLASVNPFSKAYDEVWTAGRAGRDRYALAEVGVRDEDLAEVGRPQLVSVSTRAPGRAVPTVLYAPTWEGWTDDPGNTSVIGAGENIVRQLLAAAPAVRVLYKPHPFTGTVNPAAKAAHQRIVALIEKANAGRTAAPQPAAMVRIASELAALSATGRPGADEAEGSRGGVITAQTMDRIRELREAWNAAYWADCPEDEHRVIEGPAGPDLFSCFNQCDLMVSDISSVVSDFVASRKPYAITDSAALGTEEFRRRNTAARAAYILGADGTGVAGLLDVLRGDAADELAEGRRELKEYLLGTDEPDSQTRFAAAVRDLADRADARLRRLEALDPAILAQD